jgi:hypothetical protein
MRIVIIRIIFVVLKQDRPIKPASAANKPLKALWQRLSPSSLRLLIKTSKTRSVFLKILIGENKSFPTHTFPAVTNTIEDTQIKQNKA